MSINPSAPETPYDPRGTCPYCGGSQYPDEGQLRCEDCGEYESGEGPSAPNAITEFKLLTDYTAWLRKIRY